jgi:hypothetical protein
MAKKLVVGAEAPLEIVTVTVSKKHYDTATKKMKSNSAYILRDCLIAQAVRSAFPGKTVSVGSDDAEVGKGKSMRKYDIDKKGQRLIRQFDDGELDRKTLPVNIKLTAIPPSRWSDGSLGTTLGELKK